MTKAVFFDAGGTLFDVKGSVGEQYARLARRHGVDVDVALLNERFKEVFKTSPPLAFPGAKKWEIKKLERQWWHGIVKSVFDDIPFQDFDRLFSEIYAFFASGAGWSVFPETMEVLERLQREKFQMGIISNFDSRLFTLCETLGIRSFFQTITLSSHHGFAKPSPDIFKVALQEARVAPSDAVYIGDSLHHDIAGAQAIGMTPLLIDRTGYYSDETGVTRIPNLRAIFDFCK